MAFGSLELSVVVFIDAAELAAGLAAPRGAGSAAAPALEGERFYGWLAAEAATALASPADRARFAGGFVYVSSAANDVEAALTAGLAAAPGVRLVSVEDRQGPSECLACDLARTPRCHRCRNMAAGSGSSRGAVAEAMATDLFRLAREETLDLAVVVSADPGLVPVVRFLQGRGKPVVHAAFPPRGRSLSESCSAVIDLWGSPMLPNAGGEAIATALE